MTYQEIKTALKAFQAQGHAIPALNSKREVLEIALAELQLLTSAPEIAIEPTAPEIVEIAIAPTTIEDIQEITPAAEETATKAATTTIKVIPQWITPEHPALTELRELARVSEMAIIWTIATMRTILKMATPHLIPIATNFNLCLRKGLDDSLKTIVVAGVLWQLWLFPKVELMAYTVGLWAVMTAIRIKKRRWAIA